MSNLVISAHPVHISRSSVAFKKTVLTICGSRLFNFAGGNLSLKLFRVGSKVVCPPHGVGRIDEVVTQTFGTSEVKLYAITVIESGMKFKIPVTQCEEKGVRALSTRVEIDKVYTIIKDRDIRIDTQTWNRRQREYLAKIKSGSLEEMAIVYRDLSLLSIGKDLSFGEKKMLDQVEELLVGEIALAKARSSEKVRGELAEMVV